MAKSFALAIDDLPKGCERWGFGVGSRFRPEGDDGDVICGELAGTANKLKRGGFFAICLRLIDQLMHKTRRDELAHGAQDVIQHQGRTVTQGDEGWLRKTERGVQLRKFRRLW